VYVCEDIFFEKLTDFEFLDEEFIKLEIKLPHETFLLCVVYRLPSRTNPFWDRFRQYIDMALQRNPNSVITGDLNVHLLTERRHTLNDMIYIYNLKNVTKSPTRICENCSSLLDYVLVAGCSTRFAEVLPIESSTSDHKTTIAEILIKSKIKKS
jgi:hypothetical protein